MSRCYTYIIVSILSSFIGKAYSQCIADAGNDTIICVPLNYGALGTLGGSPLVTGGSGPYTYSWSCDYWIQSFHLTASDFLDDTTIANPSLISNLNNLDSITFHLKVVDGTSQICEDSVKITFSQFGYVLGYAVYYINPGDSIQLPGSTVGGGIGPLKYHWTPTFGLQDSTDVYTWAKPDTTTSYSTIATDSIGCISSPSLSAIVYINPTSIKSKNTGDELVVLYPNPASEEISFHFNLLSSSLVTLSIHNATCEKILRPVNEENLTGPQDLRINVKDLSPGVYIYNLNIEDEFYEGKIIIQR
jgi:hypothetical protein